MLLSLSIKNFAIVKQLELDFAHGMTAFTGETGAGKSIMIDALMLALGGRADASVIRPHEDKCDITAVFQCAEQGEAADWLEQHAIDCSGEVILRRVLYSEGRSKSYLNGQALPLQKIKEFSEILVHIHGQHQHQTLMNHATHRQHLDEYAGHDALLAEVGQSYKQYQNTQKELQKLKTQEQNNDRIQLLQFQIDELQALDLQENEMQSLGEEHQLLHHAQDFIYRSQEVVTHLNGDDQPNVIRSLHQCLHLLSELPQTSAAIKTTQEMLNSALIQCEEAHDEMQRFMEAIQLDPERLQQLEKRMGVLHQAARKYHLDVKELPAHAQQLAQELTQMKERDERIALLEKTCLQQLSQYKQLAQQLTASRQNFATRLAEDISAIIRQLGMPKGYISVEITPLEKMQSHGVDKVEYKVCTNPGMAPDSLQKIASGGELSRISLAIQMITAQRGATPTLLFDEVDVGIGGATAALVGQLLRKLGGRLQVFCVTHQPQVASAAHHHFLVQKHSDEQHTFSTIIALDEQERINEIARMLGGITITEQTRSHARELLHEQA